MAERIDFGSICPLEGWNEAPPVAASYMSYAHNGVKPPNIGTTQRAKTEYVKWVITVPPQQVEELGWNQGQELESAVNGESLVVKRASDIEPKADKMTYEDFREKIARLLKSEKKGLSWTEIREKLNFPQKVPNNLWVRTMERDIGLIRQFDNQTGRVVWRLK